MGISCGAILCDDHLHTEMQNMIPQVCFTIRLAENEKIFNVPRNLAVQHIPHILLLGSEGLGVETITNIVAILLY